MKSRVHGVIVAVAFCSWFATSNHCAFASLATRADAVLAECPFHSKPAKPEKQSTGAQCCKILRAIVPVVSKDWSPDHANFSAANFCPEKPVGVERSQSILGPLFLDTGPPGVFSFAELILQRSVLAHAPPFST